MLAWRIAGSLAQPSTFTTLAANGPPSCAASARGTTNSAKSIEHGDAAGGGLRLAAGGWRLAAGGWRRAPGHREDRAPEPPEPTLSTLNRIEVQGPQQVAIDELERHARLAGGADRVRVAQGLAQPRAPVVVAARRAHAPAPVVVEDGVVAAEHHLVEERLQRQLAVLVRDDVEDVAVEDELRDRSRSEQVAHLRGPGGEGHRGSGVRLRAQAQAHGSGLSCLVTARERSPVRAGVRPDLSPSLEP